MLCSWARHFTLTGLSPPRSKWVPANCQGNLTKCWEVTCDGLASHPGGVAILLVASCYRNWNKLRQQWTTRLVRLDLMTVTMYTVILNLNINEKFYTEILCVLIFCRFLDVHNFFKSFNFVALGVIFHLCYIIYVTSSCLL